uniref:SHSP domain-containing protein n=1 Tax=Aegilops tauschii subsp. strangulata TaxID=200361 RepID=A0A453A3M7_AEGTS
LMAATGTKQQQPTATPVATVVDPKFEWAEKEDSYVLRLTLTGFRKEDFRVQVDGTGKLTVRGATRPGAGGPGSALYRVFQLPATASLEDIAGRFEAGVLTLTVPKLASSGAEHAQPDDSAGRRARSAHGRGGQQTQARGREEASAGGEEGPAPEAQGSSSGGSSCGDTREARACHRREGQGGS